MDIQSLVQYKKSKRRERAARMATEAEPVGILDDLDSAEEDTDLLKLKPPRPPRPKKVKEMLKEPLYEEDIVEGFSFCSFNTFEDLEKMAKWSSQHNGKYPDPYSKLKLDEEKKIKKKKKKKDKDRDRDSILSQIDPNTNKGSSGSSSEKGYICDSDSDGDKGSDTGVGDLFRARKLSNVCQNGLSAGGAVNSANLPAVPLPESVARSLHSATAGAPYHASAHQQQGHLAVATSSAGAAAAAPPPKPLYRPFALSPPPSTPKVSTATPHTPATPFYPPYSNPFFPNSYNPFYPTSSTSFNNGLFPPPQTTTPTSTLATHTVASSHHDLTCKSHLPKLAHALTNSAPRATPTATPIKSSYPSLPLNDPANLRRELDNRYLHDRSLIRPPTYMGSADVSNPLTARLAPPFQRPPNNQSPGFLSASLGKDPKMGGPNSLFAGLGTPQGFPGISPLDPLRSSSSGTSSGSIMNSASAGSSSGSAAPKKNGKWNAMHVRIAWEIYNHQQKQKGGVDKKDNPLVPSTSSSLSSPSINKATPTTTATPSIIPPVPSSASIAAGHKRPSSGQPDFMHKRKATDADLLRSQLFAPPRPPGPPPPPAATPGHLDHALSNHLLPRPPYMSPFGPTPLQSALSPFGPQPFGSSAASAASAAPFGGLGSLRDSALNASNPLSSYPALASSSAPPVDLLGRPFSTFSSPTTSNTWQPKRPAQSPATPKLKSPMESPNRNGLKTNGRAPSISPVNLKKEEEITVVGEKVNVPNGRTSVESRPPSSATPSTSKIKSRIPGIPPHGHPPVSMGNLNPFHLPGMYPAPPPGLPPPPTPFASPHLDPFRDPYRALANPYLQSRESLLRLNQLMMTEQERIRMGLAAFPPTATPPGLMGASPSSSLLSKPPTLPGPPLGYPNYHLPGLAPPPPPHLPSSAAPPINGTSSTYHAK